jgi:hypothetical protein
MHVADDLYTGGFTGTQSLSIFKTAQGNPTMQEGVGPLGRIVFHNITPLALATANIAALQHTTASTPFALTAGTGITAGLAPDGSGATVYVLDVPRCISLTSSANMSAGNITIVGYDLFGRKQTQTRAGPNANTVNTLKAFMSVLSITSDTTDGANSISVGTSDIFGLPWVLKNIAYMIRQGWDSTLAQNAGTAVVADTTSPATASTGDTRGTYAQAGNASNGSRLLLLGWHLDGTQCGSTATVANAIGVTPA